MKERPILFNAPMVRAILAGTKTQTRRVVKITHSTPGLAACLKPPVGTPRPRVAAELCPYGQPGDRLWVREAHSIFPAHGQHRDDGLRWGPWGGLPTVVSPNGKQIAYFREGFDRCDPAGWRPNIHMPRWASRILLDVADVRVERLQDIGEADAIAEGIERGEDFFGCPCWKVYGEPAGSDVVFPDDPIGSYASLWTSINGPGSWDANPWVWAIEFRRIAP